MPLLKRESDIFPTEIFDLAVEQFPWWVAHVRSRQEKSLARHLQPLGVAFFLPQRESRTRRRGRNLTSHLPLFPGYVFFRGGAPERLAALRSGVIVSVLGVADQDLLSAELLQLHELQRRGAAVIACEPLSEGESVRIVDGAFRGYTGVVLRGGDRPRLVVSISILRKAVTVELERDSVSPLRAASRSREDVRSAVA